MRTVCARGAEYLGPVSQHLQERGCLVWAVQDQVAAHEQVGRDLGRPHPDTQMGYGVRAEHLEGSAVVFASAVPFPAKGVWTSITRRPWAPERPVALSSGRSSAIASSPVI